MHSCITASRRNRRKERETAENKEAYRQYQRQSPRAVQAPSGGRRSSGKHSLPVECAGENEYGTGDKDFGRQGAVASDAVGVGQRISEEPDFGDHKGEEHEEKCDDREQKKGKLRMLTNDRFAVKQARFGDIGDRRGDEEDRNIHPVGRAPDGAVIGVKEDGNQNESEEYAAKLNAPKILSVPQRKAFDKGEEQHRPKEKLHMLPRRFVYP